MSAVAQFVVINKDGNEGSAFDLGSNVSIGRFSIRRIYNYMNHPLSNLKILETKIVI